MSEDLIDRVPCLACGAERGEKCRTVIDGVNVQWEHDARILLDGGLRPHAQVVSEP